MTAMTRQVKQNPVPVEKDAIDPQDQKFMELINEVAAKNHFTSDRQIAEAIGVEPTTFSRWRRCGPFSYRVLRVFFSISDHLGRSLDKLRTEIEDKAYEPEKTVEDLISDLNSLQPEELIKINIAIAQRMQDFI